MVMTHISKALVGVSNLDERVHGDHLNSQNKCIDQEAQINNHKSALSKIDLLIKDIKVNGENFESCIIEPGSVVAPEDVEDNSIPTMENIILYFSTKGSLLDKEKAQVEAFITLMQKHTMNSVGSNITLIRSCNDPVCCKRKNIGWFQTLRDFDGNLPMPIPDPLRAGHFMPLKERLFDEDKNIYMDKHLPSMKGNPSCCKECGRRVLSKTDLTNHMRLVHSKKSANENSDLSDTDDYDSEVELILRELQDEPEPSSELSDEKDDDKLADDNTSSEKIVVQPNVFQIPEVSYSRMLGQIATMTDPLPPRRNKRTFDVCNDEPVVESSTPIKRRRTAKK
ncbi:hypothetical protein AKO1_001268 [Acrasis kona]|uniref:C2H2-type domain-containing protein n=1 Tax=Acrasis kona TaxID=1008807 RepID=A0AAW2ZBV8_9EUKA